MRPATPSGGGRFFNHHAFLRMTGPMGMRSAIWLGFLVVVTHNAEEYLAMGGFLDAHRDELPAFLLSMTGEHFAVSLVLVTLLALLVTWAAARSRPNGPGLVLAVAFQGVMAVNAASVRIGA